MKVKIYLSAYPNQHDIFLVVNGSQIQWLSGDNSPRSRLRIEQFLKDREPGMASMEVMGGQVVDLQHPDNSGRSEIQEALIDFMVSNVEELVGLTKYQIYDTEVAEYDGASHFEVLMDINKAVEHRSASIIIDDEVVYDLQDVLARRPLYAVREALRNNQQIVLVFKDGSKQFFEPVTPMF